MSDEYDPKVEVLRRHREAVVLTREKDGKTQYRIAPYEHSSTYLSSWCSTEERAWKSADSRYWNRVYSRESW